MHGASPVLGVVSPFVLIVDVAMQFSIVFCKDLPSYLLTSGSFFIYWWIPFSSVYFGSISY